MITTRSANPQGFRTFNPIGPLRRRLARILFERAVIGSGHDEDVNDAESVHVSRRYGDRGRQPSHGPRAGPAAARSSVNHGPRPDLYAAIDSGAQHGHAGGP